MDNWLKLLENRFNIENPYQKICLRDNVYKISYFSDEDINFLVFDLSLPEAELDYELIDKLCDEEEGYPYVITVFKDLRQEREKYWQCYNAIQKSSKRNKLDTVMGYKESIYTSIGSEIKLNVADGINFLNYKTKSNDDLKGTIYSLSFYELKKLFNVTGRRLFNQNVRFGVESDNVASKIRKEFKNYVGCFIWKHMTQKDNLEDIKDNLELFEIDIEREEYYTPEYFWFRHNGITIFVDGNVIFPYNTIIFNPQKATVINGAQTLSKFFNVIDEFKHTILPTLKLDVDILNDIMKSIFVKTIIISSENKDLVQSITLGLNTQVPIKEESTLAITEPVKEINEVLKKEKVGIKIIKDGEEVYYDGLYVLEFIKLYYIFKLKPGKSKNYSKKDLSSDLKNIDNYEQLAHSLRFILDVECWWKNNKRIIEESDQNDSNLKILCKYGKNYFLSYAFKSLYLIEKNTEILDERLFKCFRNFFKTIVTLKKDLALEDFKSDDLSDSLLKTLDLNVLDTVIEVENKNNRLLEILKSTLNNNPFNAYALNKKITETLMELNIELPRFRIITMKENKCKEHFVFNSKVFNELVDSFNSDNQNIKEFNQSLFYEELIKKIPIFILHIEDNVVLNIEFIEEFSFEPYLEQAKEVYNRTIEAFEFGDENKFVRASEDKSFHIRPKALNKNDTFKFTNDEYITKRSFWANKKTIEDIIRNYLKK